MSQFDAEVDLHLKERENYILYLLEKHNRVGIEELCSIFNIAASTMRKELADMERKGLLIRTRGGAVSRDRHVGETLTRRCSINVKQKEAIAKAMRAKLVDGETIILGSGSTILFLCQEMLDLKKSTIITNSLAAVNILTQNPHIVIRIFGGFYSERSGSLVGVRSNNFIESAHADKTILSPSAISSEDGPSCDSILIARIENVMATYTKEVFALCDCSKLEKMSLAPVADIERIDNMITDNHAPLQHLEAFQSKGVKVTVAE